MKDLSITMNQPKIIAFLRIHTEKKGIIFLRFSVGIIYVWFGLLKFFPQTSPAEAIVTETLETISLGLFHGRIPVFVLGLFEIGIGFGLLLQIEIYCSYNVLSNDWDGTPIAFVYGKNLGLIPRSSYAFRAIYY